MRQGEAMHRKGGKRRGEEQESIKEGGERGVRVEPIKAQGEKRGSDSTRFGIYEEFYIKASLRSSYRSGIDPGRYAEHFAPLIWNQINIV